MHLFNGILKKIFVLQYRLYKNSKQAAELSFWLHEATNLKKWYNSQISFHYGVPPPETKEKISRYSLEENAIRTWAFVHRDKYLRHLMVPGDYFAGMTLLDVGCGPIPYALGFIDCSIYGLDPLIEAYKRIGYPLESYSDRIKYIEGYAEDMPFEDNSIEAVISVNALDHVDDFRLTAGEICRVLKPDGILRIELHYHEPRETEPWALNDDIVAECFEPVGGKKVVERSIEELYPTSTEKTEKLVVWSNR